VLSRWEHWDVAWSLPKRLGEYRRGRIEYEKQAGPMLAGAGDKARYVPPVGLPPTPAVKAGDRYIHQPGWKQFANEDGEPDFFNAVTRKTQLEPPVVTRTPLPFLRGSGGRASGSVAAGQWH
jgi:hypothetical protein